MAADGRIVLVRQTNRGLSAARNAGAACATGDALLFLDADDRLEENALAVLSYALHVYPEAAYAYSYQQFFGDLHYVVASQSFNAYDLIWLNHPSVAALIRRTAFEQTPGYRSVMTYGYEDWEHWITLMELNLRGVCIPIPVFEHRKHGQTMTSRAHENREYLFERLLDLHPTLYRPDTVSRLKRQERPSLSIIVLMGDKSEDLIRTLNSLAHQTIEDIDLILVEGSHLQTSVLTELSSLSHRRIHAMADLRETLNNALVLARSEYLLVLEAGDNLKKTGLEQLLLAACADQLAAFVTGRFQSRTNRRLAWTHSPTLLARDVLCEIGGFVRARDIVQMEADQRHLLEARGYRGHRIGSIGTARAILRPIFPGFVRRSSGIPRSQRFCRTLDGDKLLQDLAVAWRREVKSTVQYHRYRRRAAPSPFLASHWCKNSAPSVLYIVAGPRLLKDDIAAVSKLKASGLILTILTQTRLHHVGLNQLLKLTNDVFVLAELAQTDTAHAQIARYLIMSRGIDVIVTRKDRTIPAIIQILERAHTAITIIDCDELLPHIDNLASLVCGARSKTKLHELQLSLLREELF
jgi:glycosyltransferase involved in cell wall biosynthesis